MDVRTGYVRASNALRWLFNRGILLDSLMFSHVTVISASLGRYLRISSRKAHVLPLGAENLGIPSKRFDSMRLLYVGSLEFRHIDRTVEGVARFAREHRGTLPISYDIVGFGPPDVEDALRRQIAASGCADLITFHGRVPYPGLRPYLERNTIGIAFVPLVDQYQCQPATKLFEYLLAGMPALATSTEENARVVTPANGVLVSDSAEGVYQGLNTLRNNLGSYASAAIRASVEEYLWENIAAHNLRPYLQQLLGAGAAAPAPRHDHFVPVQTEKGVP
jgi:glycosyltransferase involved in cell wall biosynthesis